MPSTESSRLSTWSSSSALGSRRGSGATAGRRWGRRRGHPRSPGTGTGRAGRWSARASEAGFRPPSRSSARWRSMAPVSACTGRPRRRPPTPPRWRCPAGRRSGCCGTGPSPRPARRGTPRHRWTGAGHGGRSALGPPRRRRARPTPRMVVASMMDPSSTMASNRSSGTSTTHEPLLDALAVEWHRGEAGGQVDDGELVAEARGDGRSGSAGPAGRRRSRPPRPARAGPSRRRLAVDVAGAGRDLEEPLVEGRPVLADQHHRTGRR